MTEAWAVRAFRWRRLLPAAVVERMSSPAAVVTVWTCYGAAFAILWMAMSGPLPLDLASSAEEIQGHLAGGYQVRNPPVFGWLLWATQLVLGKSIVSHMVLRYGLILAIGALYYVAVRQIVADRRMAGAVSFSLTLFIWFLWDFHYRVTHTLPMIVAGLAAWLLLVAWIERQTVVRAAGLGLALGLGLLSKWNFALLVAGLAAAVLADRHARRTLADWRALLIPLIAVVPFVPLIAWLSEVGGNIVGTAERAMVASDQAPYLDRVAEGLREFVEGYLYFLLPWIAFVAFEAWLAWRRPPPPMPVAVDWRGRLCLSATVWATLFLVAAIVLFGIDNMSLRYLYPVLLLAPIVAAAWLAGRVEIDRFAAGLMTGSLILTIVALSVRLATFYVQDIPRPMQDHQLHPYPALADALRERGFADAQFVTITVRDAGNLISLLPGARAMALDTYRVEPPPPDDIVERNCVALWGGHRSFVGEPVKVPETPAQLATVVGQDSEIEDIVVAWAVPLYGRPRQTVWRVAVIPSNSPACLSARGLEAERPPEAG